MSDTYDNDRSYDATPANSDPSDDFGAGGSQDPSDASSNVWMSESGEPDREPDDADTTPIFDSVSAWFQRRSPASPLPTRRATPPSPLRRPGPTLHRGPAIQRGDSRPPESSGRPGGRGATIAGGGGATIAGGEGTRPGPASSFLPPAPMPAPASGQDIPAPELPARAGAGMGAPAAYSPGPMSSPVAAGAGAGNATTASAGADAMSWSSAGDAGWQAAEATRQPVPGGTTRAGLPLRVPMTHLVPGTAEPGPRRRPPDAPTRSPEAVGGRLASFYQGVRQGRDVIKDAAPTHRRDAQEDM